MHLRKLTFIVGLVGALCCTAAYGLGLGEITVHSSLNEPLDAEIRLLQVRNLTEEDILVELADAEAFQRFGVDRVFFLQRLNFDVQLDHPAGPRVRVTTDEPVREPYLVFLLEAQSSGGGRLLREYTLLMDIPVFAGEPAQPVQGVQTRPEPQQARQQPPALPAQPRQQAQEPPRAQPRPAPQQRQGEPPRAQPAPQRSVSSQPGDDVYGVQANDTLWEIALRVRPSGNVSVQQTMLALQRLNPEAFIDGNINLLKRGQVLRIPDQSEIGRVDQRAAVSEVALQNTRWVEGRGGQVAGAELEASRTRPSAQNDQQTRRGQLTLAAPGDVQGAGTSSGAGDTSASTEALENELAVTAEELDAARRENEELNMRVAELEEQIQTMERLIEVSNEEMRALQLAAEQSDQPAEIDSSAAEAETDSEQGSVDSAAPAQVTEDAAAQQQGEEAQAQGPEPVAQPTTTVVPRAPPEPTVVDLLMANIWYLLIALLAILGGVAFFLHRRSQAEMESFDSFEDDDLFEPEDDQPGDSEFLQASADFDEQLDMEADDQPLAEEEAEAEAPVEPETGDAVAEADIYIAYGKFDQAEEMLQKALADEPNNVEARLKLLEVHAETKDVEKFDREYGQLMAMGDSGATARAAELRNSIPGAGQFGGEDGMAEMNSADSAPADGDGSLDFSGGDFSSDDFNFDDSESTAQAPAQESNQPLAASSDELGDLTLDLDSDAVVSSSESSGSESGDQEEAFDFDFDLETDGESKTENAGEFDLSDSFSATNDSVTDSQNDDFELPTADSDQESGGLDFSLDLDDAGTDTGEDEVPGFGEASTDEGSELSLDLDLGDDEADADSDLSLDLDDESFAAAPQEDALQSDDDILSDLEFTAATLTDNESGSTENHAEPAHQADSGSTSPASKSDDDDFDMDMGDLDLAALDQEMDALVGDVDDPADDDVAVVSPTETVPALNEKTAAGLKQDFSLDDLAADLTTKEADSPDWSTQSSPETFDFGEDQDVDVDGDLDSELDFLADSDEVATKLDLARAYIDMGDQDGAKDILDEVRSEGTDEQKREAAELLEKMA